MEKKRPGSMREAMPTVAAWIDELRAEFGAEGIDAQIRAGMRGEPVFWASEAGHTVGTPVTKGVEFEYEMPSTARKD
jgi:hypothetical protein